MDRLQGFREVRLGPVVHAPPERIQKLRHRADYESVGLATRTQVDELGKVVEKPQTVVMALVR